MKKLLYSFTLAAMCTSTNVDAQTLSTFAGSSNGYLNGIGTNAKFSGPYSICVDTLGYFYVADINNHRIRKISPTGEVTTFAGGIRGMADGADTLARFDKPTGICIDTLGNLFVVDNQNHLIRKITPAGVVSTFAGGGTSTTIHDGVGTAARFYYPLSICIDLDGNLYVSEEQHRIRKITPAAVVTTFAGKWGTDGYVDSIGTEARFYKPKGLCADKYRNIYVADYFNRVIRKISPAGVVSTYAGINGKSYIDGACNFGGFFLPVGLTFDKSGNLFVSDDYKIRVVTPSCEIKTVIGSTRGYIDGDKSIAKLDAAAGLCANDSGIVYFAESGSNVIRKLIPGTITGSNIKEHNYKQDYTIFPNPASNTVTIDNLLNDSYLSITDITGRQLYSTITNAPSLNINTSNFHNGIYFINIVIDGKSINKKLIVTH